MSDFWNSYIPKENKWGPITGDSPGGMSLGGRNRHKNLLPYLLVMFLLLENFIDLVRDCTYLWKERMNHLRTSFNFTFLSLV